MIAKNVTENIGNYLRENRINLSKLSRNSGIPYRILYTSVWDKGRVRELRANELMSICLVLRINPMDFADKAEEVK